MKITTILFFKAIHIMSNNIISFSNDLNQSGKAIPQLMSQTTESTTKSIKEETNGIECDYENGEKRCGDICVQGTWYCCTVGVVIRNLS